MKLKNGWFCLWFFISCRCYFPQSSIKSNFYLPEILRYLKYEFELRLKKLFSKKLNTYFDYVPVIFYKGVNILHQNGSNQWKYRKGKKHCKLAMDALLTKDGITDNLSSILELFLAVSFLLSFYFRSSASKSPLSARQTLFSFTLFKFHSNSIKKHKKNRCNNKNWANNVK